MTNYPSTLDALVNPLSTDGMNAVPHATQHTNANDAIEALQAKVGIDASADTNSMDYKIANLGTASALDSIDEDNMATDSNTRLPTQQSVKAYVDAQIAAINIEAFPVGAIYTNVTGTNPGTELGYGTWTAFGAGRVPVGYDSGQTEFDTVEETGGAKTHTLTEAEMPAHTHTQNAHTHTQNAHTHNIGNTGSSGAFGRLDSATASSSGSPDTSSTTAVNQNATATNQNTGGGGAHNNLQPYIVVHMWKRTA